MDVLTSLRVFQSVSCFPLHISHFSLTDDKFKTYCIVTVSACSSHIFSNPAVRTYHVLQNTFRRTSYVLEFLSGLVTCVFCTLHSKSNCANFHLPHWDLLHDT